MSIVESPLIPFQKSVERVQRDRFKSVDLEGRLLKAIIWLSTI